jgi:dipeptidase E
MRLFLSSSRLGERAGSLLALLGSGSRAAIIENGHDLMAENERAAWDSERPDPAADLAALGIHSSPLDLRHYFGDPEGLRAKLRGFDLVWVGGGNVFVLRHAMRRSGFDEIITTMLAEDSIAYGGECAGAAVVSPSLESFAHADNPGLAPRDGDPAREWDGLGLIDHTIVPHYRSPHHKSSATERVVRHLNGRALRYRALRDGEAIVWVEDRRPLPALREFA